MPRHTILIASYLEPEHVERIRDLDPDLDVIYEPELLRPPRYPADHGGQPGKRSPEQEARWRELLQQADILFDFDTTHREDLPDLATRVRWIQATSAGIGQFVKRLRYDVRMPNTTFTTASGVHAGPLAEFCALAMLTLTKGLPRVLEDQRRKHWERYAGTDLEGRTMVVVGLGAIGQRVARFGKAFGMKVVGIKRDPGGIEPGAVNADELYPPSELHMTLSRAEFLILVTPHTPETEKLLGEKEFAALPKGAFFINIGRGAVVDEPALIASLQSGHLGGAALDVFAREPLPRESPLWEMSNVLVSPHSASTSNRENERLTDLFCENARRYLRGEALLNVLDTEKLY